MKTRTGFTQLSLLVPVPVRGSPSISRTVIRGAWSRRDTLSAAGTGVAPARYTGWRHAGMPHLLGCGAVQVVFGFTPR